MSGIPASGSEDDMKNELANLQFQANKTTDESLESTRRMMTLCEESQDVGIKTLVMLDEQGEQLDRIEEGMDQINTDMKDAEKNLEGMEKCCGLCVLPWKRAKKFDDKGTWKANDDGTVNTDGPRVMVGGEAIMSGAFVTKITNDAREDEMEQNLGEVSGMLGNLRNMAVDMGNEIGSQNRQLDRINQKGTSLTDRVDTANKRAVKILRNQ
ncbi:synaptosomal-associated protein 25-like isoform X5 [Mercenaria mercenaria]|uniref:synaptosomal-associated protein 25-like isoform X5 n=1 Tax=Mercenaria mercenaria TaxID=6596 RepID=UPI001E1DD6B4|nr:synaptosomal-associated protein 25-like isoform X5 [Mercenaria mercenaria]